MNSILRIVGISFEKADLNTRGLFTLSEAETYSFYDTLHDLLNINESFILSTCNRTEIYYCANDNYDAEIIKLLCIHKGIFNHGQFLASFDSYADDLAIKHLFGVSVGLKSQVLGDQQIIGQLKQAYQLACDYERVGPYLHRVLHAAFATNKMVCQDTQFKQGAASVSYNAVKVLQAYELAGKTAKILVIGAGEMGTDVCSYLHKRDFGNVTITNRTAHKAAELACAYSYNVIPYEDHYTALNQFDVIISTIDVQSPLYNPDNIPAGPTFNLLDLSTHPSFSAAITKNLNHYFNLDDISLLVGEALEARKNEIPKVSNIIDKALKEFKQWQNDTRFSPIVKEFQKALNELSKKAVQPYLKEIDTKYHALIDDLTESVVQKIVKLPAIQLRIACQRGDVETLSEPLRQLFNLDITNEQQFKVD